MCVLPGSPEDVAAHRVIDDLTAAFARGDTSTDAYFRRAVAHKQTFHLQAAIDDFTAVIDRAPRADMRLGRAHFLRSICHRRTGRIAEAIDDGDAAVALRPDDSHVWTVRGFALAQADRLDDAERDLEQAIALDPENWLAEVCVVCGFQVTPPSVVAMIAPKVPTAHPCSALSGAKVTLKR